MIRYEDMPKNNEDLRNIEIDFPPVSFSECSDPKEIEPSLLEYLDLEGFKPDGSLQFVRTALVNDVIYWIWEFVSDGQKTFATATQDAISNTSLGCETDYYALTPEQFILGNFHNCF